MTNIYNRTAFITGGANGIGLGIARALAKKSVKLSLVDLDATALERAREEFDGITQIETAVLDVRDRAAYARIADEVEAKLGPVSILVNNAGVAGGAPADKLNFELWDWGMEINLGGVINGVQTFLPRIFARGQGGHIVNTSSLAGLIEMGSGVLYHTAKYAVTGMSEALHAELAPAGIGVTLLCPGAVATGIVDRTRAAQPRVTDALSPDQRSRAFASYEANKKMLAAGAEPDDVGEMVLQAIESNRLYIQTSTAGAAAITARTEALLAAMPS